MFFNMAMRWLHFPAVSDLDRSSLTYILTSIVIFFANCSTISPVNGSNIVTRISLVQPSGYYNAPKKAGAWPVCTVKPVRKGNIPIQILFFHIWDCASGFYL